jgi:hypothetical protein
MGILSLFLGGIGLGFMQDAEMRLQPIRSFHSEIQNITRADAVTAFGGNFNNFSVQAVSFAQVTTTVNYISHAPQVCYSFHH